MVKERLKFFIRFKKNTDSTISRAIAKQEKLDAMKMSYASNDHRELEDIFVDYEQYSKIYWVERCDFYNNYYDPVVAFQFDNSFNDDVSISYKNSIKKDSATLTSQIYNGKSTDSTSLFKKFCQRKLTPHGIFHLAVVLVLVSLCSLQCYKMIVSYSAYPSSVNLKEHIPSLLLETLPGITICNNNRLSVRRLMSRNSKIKQEIETAFGTQWDSKSFSKEELDEYRDKLNMIFLRLGYNADEEVLGTSMSGQFKIKPDPSTLVKRVDCARSWVDTLECEQFEQIHSIQDRRCTTFFYEGVLYYNLINRPDLFNSSRISSSGQNSYFDTKQVARFILDFQASDYGDLKRQIGARITFHSRQHIATHADVDFFVTRGFHYDFHISRLDTYRLGYPYDTHCRDYRKDIRKYANPNASTRVELNRQACVQKCIVENAIKTCNCWPPLVPYFDNDELDVDKNVGVCRWASSTTFYNKMNMTVTRNGKAKNLTTHKYFDCYKVFHRRCHQTCPAECMTSQYSVVSERMKWPSDAKLRFDDSQDKSAELNRSCCALITIKFADFQHTVHEYVPKLNLLDLIGNLGGLLALWLGLSIVSVYYTVQKLVKVIKDRRRNNRRVRPL